ncbi:MAG: hypothetical protein MJE12_09205 [Alphaproteobacteria bacterium]|nr:hypothetical protein [Alphaproteobacteria bacterium]
MGFADDVLAETLWAARDLDVSEKYASYGGKNPLLKGKLETCGFNLRTALGANGVSVRGASSEQTEADMPSRFGFAGRRSVVETEVSSSTGKRPQWAINSTFVRIANSAGDFDVGAGLNLKTRLLDGKLVTQSSMAWVNKQEGDEAQLALAQRHKLTTRLFALKPQKIKAKAIGHFERVEPGHAGPAAKRKADRQEASLGTELAYRGLRFNVTRTTKFDNVANQNDSTNRWDSWSLGSTLDLGTLGFKGRKLNFTWQTGGAFLDSGKGFLQQDANRSFKVKLEFNKAFSTEFSNHTLQKLGSEGGNGPDTTNALGFNWKRSAGPVSANANVKVKHWERRSDDSEGYSVSLGFEAKSKRRDNMRLKLGAKMRRSATEQNTYGLSSRLFFYF